MSQIFFDLIQTPSVVVPVGLALLVLACFTLIVYFLAHEEDDNDISLERQEIARRNLQEAKLKHFAETGEINPPWARVDTLNRGANVARTLDATTRVVNTPYSDMASTYGFETHKHHQRGELILFDTRFEALDAAKRMVVLPVGQVIQADTKSLKRLIARHRHYINRKAQRAGLLTVRSRPGNPGKGVSA